MSNFDRKREEIFLGEDQDSGDKIFLSEEDRSAHIHILGSTGKGKSKLMELMIREDILAGEGLCLIDPHGYLYKDIVKFCASKDLPDLKKKIILFNPTRDDYVVGYNPLRRNSKDISHQVDWLVRAFCRAWGTEEMNQTPLLTRRLRNIFLTLIEQNLTLIEAQYLIDQINSELKEIASINRLMEFLSSQRMRRILAQKEKSLDFRKIMDEGYVLLVNLSFGQRISEDNARILGTLIVNDLFQTATDRLEGGRPFYLYIDEFSRFVNGDMARILDECRKFGLHLILAHQHLQHLKREDEPVYYSVLTNAKTKAVFGGLNSDDARVMAREIFGFDADRPLEEQLDKAMSIIRNQPAGNCLIKIGENKVIDGKIREVEEPLVSERNMREFEESCYSDSPFSLPVKKADELIEQRKKQFLESKREEVEPETFRELKKEES